ncbi:MAG: hypothetical protein ABI855_11060, partial [Bacteroidota bacterium]
MTLVYHNSNCLKNLFLKIFFILFYLSSFAQENKFDFTFHKSSTQKNLSIKNDFTLNFLSPFSAGRSLFFQGAPIHASGSCVPFMSTPVHYTAFFCKIENRMHERFNVWIKFRAGDDESYRKITEER